MRTAIILSGHSRTWKNTIKSFWSTFGHLNPDVFFHTWNVTGASDKLWWSNGEQNIEPTDLDKMVELYNPMGYEIEPEIEWEECGLAKEHHGDYSRMRSQWYSPLQAFEMVMHREPYDVVVKTRFDIDYLEPLQADILNVVRNGNLMLFSPYPISTQRGVYSDTVVIARPNIMEKYLNYFHHIEEFFHQSKVKMGVPGYCSEYGATAYMKFNGFWGTVPGFMTIKPSIVRSNGERIKLYP